jgi:hypothetical protein
VFCEGEDDDGHLLQETASQQKNNDPEWTANAGVMIARQRCQKASLKCATGSASADCCQVFQVEWSNR